LRAVRLGMLNFLQQHDIGIVTENLRDGQFEVDGRAVGICIIPTLAELHIELKDFERTHGQGTA